MKHDQLSTLVISAFLLVTSATGCALVPETRHRDRIHNPFPQLARVAVLPFFNQSNEPTIDTDLVSAKYYAALQAIPGFEVLPVGVVRTAWMRFSLAHGEPKSGADFQRLAKALGVDAVVVGSVTDFDSYYPPRMAMTVHWYAANEGFHRIPVGYGLPWGTEGEQEIPQRIAREAEFELARSQLATQTPLSPTTALTDNNTAQPRWDQRQAVRPATNVTVSGEHDVFAIGDADVGALDQPDVLLLDAPKTIGNSINDTEPVHGFAGDAVASNWMPGGEFPADWPDATDLIPNPPAPVRPVPVVNHDPVLSHTRLYRGDDPYFTNRLSDHVETGDDARPDGWQGYLKRSDDFIHFCCQLHITEMLESRGGSDQSDLILRWPLSRY